MRSRLAWASLALFATSLLTGCAGGWRHGEAPGGGGGATPGAKVAAAPASGSRAAASPGLPAADGMTFMYQGAATSVALAGDFNAWSTSADPMTRQADGSWTLVKQLEPGRHLYKFVIDGGTWKEDPNATEFSDDGYGGKNSVVVVAGGATAPAVTGTVPATTPAAVKGGAPAQTAEGATFAYRGAANSVALAGDFNAWSTSADPMTRQADGSWTLVKRLEPGRHLYKFVIDGGTWKEDPDAAEFDDDGYGGKNSVVVVVASGATTPAVTGTVPATTPTAGKGQAPAQTADGVTFTYAGPAGTVNLAGDFNAWSTTADPMVKQSDGTWTMTKKLAPGKYTYKFLVDGTAWKQDEANPVSTSDPYGGKNSVCTVK